MFCCEDKKEDSDGFENRMFFQSSIRKIYHGIMIEIFFLRKIKFYWTRFVFVF